MPKLKANALVIKSAAKGPRATYTIDGHPGLYLQARGDGNASWVMRYRVSGKQREHTLHSDARNADFDKIIDAKDTWRLAAQVDQRDLKAEREAEEAAKAAEAIAATRTFATCFEAWVTHTGKRRQRELSPRTEEEYRRIYRLHIEKRLGAKPISDITKADVAACLDAAKKASTDAAKGHRGTQALKALKIIRPVCEMAVDAEWIDRNPCRGIDDPVPRNNPKGKSHRPLTDEELRILWREMPDTMAPAVVRVLKLTLLLGRRISELAGAQRHELLLEMSPPCLLIPADREGNKSKRDDVVPLPRLALAIICEALAVGEKTDPLFVGAADRGTASHEFMLFRRAKGWPGRTRLHDARTLINDHMARMLIPSEMRSRTLAHSGDLRQLVNTAYSQYDHLPERYRALRLWQARLINIVGGRRTRVLRWYA